MFNSIGQTIEKQVYGSENDTSNVEFKEFETNCLCVLPNSYVIIDSDSSWLNLIPENHVDPNCIDYPEDFDINNEVIIGIGARSGGCSRPKVDISIYKINSLKELEVRVKIIRVGGCAAMNYKYVWIKFNKPGNEYKIRVLDTKNKLKQIKSCFE